VASRDTVELHDNPMHMTAAYRSQDDFHNPRSTNRTYARPRQVNVTAIGRRRPMRSDTRPVNKAPAILTKASINWAPALVKWVKPTS
jgi:hypothetical protein